MAGQRIQSNSETRDRWIARAIVGTLLALALLAICFAARRLRDGAQDMACKKHLKALYLHALDNRQGMLPNSELVKAARPELLICPTCRSAYIYRPCPGRVSYTGATRSVVAWCPSACHKGHRNCLLEDGAVMELPSEQEGVLATTQPVVPK